MRNGLTSKRTGRFGLARVTQTSNLMLLAATLYGITGVGSASAQSSYPDLDAAEPDLTKRLVSGARLVDARLAWHRRSRVWVFPARTAARSSEARECAVFNERFEARARVARRSRPATLQSRMYDFVPAGVTRALSPLTWESQRMRVLASGIASPMRRSVSTSPSPVAPLMNDQRVFVSAKCQQLAEIRIQRESCKRNSIFP